MRKRLLPIFGLFLLLLIGFGAGFFWWMDAQSTQRANTPLGASRCAGKRNDPGASAGNSTANPAGEATPEHSSTPTRGKAGTEDAPPKSPEPESTAPEAEPEPKVPPEEPSTEEPPGGRFKFSCTISGRVIDQSDRGIADVEVFAVLLMHCATKSGEARSRGPTRHTTSWITDENGHYTATIKLGADLEIQSVDATMSAELAGFAPLAVVPVDRIKVEEERANVNITMVPGGSIAGLVRDETGNPLEGIVVFAVLRGRDTSGAGRAGTIVGAQYQIRTGSDGRYRIPAAKEGVWGISAISGTHGIVKTSPVVTVIAGREAHADDIVLGVSVVVKLRLLDPEGRPIKAGKSKTLHAEAQLKVNGSILRTNLAIDETGVATVRNVPVETTEITAVLGEHLEKELGRRLYGEPVLVALQPNIENDIGEVQVRPAN